MMIEVVTVLGSDVGASVTDKPPTSAPWADMNKPLAGL